MAENIRPVRLSTHSEKSWRPSSGFAFARNSIVVPIAAEELAQSATQYPLAFVDEGQVRLVVLLGLQPQQNLFVGPDGRWLGDYVPAVLRGYPFKLLPADNEQFALGYDESSGLLLDGDEGESFFEAEGEPTERIRQILQFLTSLNRGLQGMATAAERLKGANILEPWPLKIRDGDREVPVNGLLRVNEAALAALDDDAFLELRRSGALILAYSQLLSASNLPRLGKLGQLHSHHAAMSEKQQQEIQSIFVPTHAEDEIDWDAMLKDDES